MDIKSTIKNIYVRLFKSAKYTKHVLTPPKYYDSIDTLPILCWHKIKETGDLKWLLRTKGNVMLVNLDVAWYKINEEFFNEFGVTDDFKRWWKYEVEYHVQLTQSYLQNDKSYRTLAFVAKAEADSMLKDIEAGSFNESIGIVSQFMGHRVNPAQTTVREFYSYIEIMRKGGKNNK